MTSELQSLLDESYPGILDAYDHHVKGRHLVIEVPSCTEPLILAGSTLASMASLAVLPSRVRDFVHIPECGFRFRNYAELAININGHIMNWPFYNCDSIQFGVDGASVSLGMCSGLWALLLGSYYEDREIAQTYFMDSLPTVIITDIGDQDITSITIAALYYINSYYLGDADICVDLCHLQAPADATGRDVDLFSRARLNQKRMVRRNSLRYQDSALLYNLAANSHGESRFVNYYRTVEYFTRLEHTNQMERARYDSRLKAADLLNLARRSNEREALLLLLENRLTAAMKRSYTNYAHRKGLISHARFESLVSGIYEYRCALVHANEQRPGDTAVPNPFTVDVRLDAWTYIMRKIACRIVSVMNRG